MSTNVTTDNKVEIKAQAIETYHECQEMLREAEAWVRAATEPNESVYRRHLYNEMERSLYFQLCHLMFTSQEHDGPIVIMRDMKGSFFWQHQESGYHGGLIFHRHHTHEGDPLIGQWSIHT